MTDLLPCPFCKSNAIVERTGKWAYGYCPSCGTNGPSDLGESGAIEQWNSRPLEQELEMLRAIHRTGRIGITYNPCEKHLNVTFNPGYCPICLLQENDELRRKCKDLEGKLADQMDRNEEEIETHDWYNQ